MATASYFEDNNPQSFTNLLIGQLLSSCCCWFRYSTVLFNRFFQLFNRLNIWG